MRPKTLSDHARRRRQQQTVAIALTLLLTLTVAHAWLSVYEPGGPRRNGAVGHSGGAKGEDAPTRTVTSPPHDDVPDFEEDGGGMPWQLERLRQRMKGILAGSKRTSSFPPYLRPPPKPFQEPPSYAPEQIRPSRTPVPRPLPSVPPPAPETPTQTQAKSGLSSHPTTTKEDGGGLDDGSTGVEFLSALETFYDNLLIEDVKGNPEQPSRSFTEINGTQGKGVALPFDPTFTEEDTNWQACDARDASFTADRDARCQAYLGNLNNMRYIKALPSRLLQGRTIKMKIYYAHDNIQAIVKIAQRKFTYEAVSEYLAFTYDRTLEFNRVPTTVFLPLPLDYLRAATSYSPLLSQWFHRFVVLYNYTNANFEQCAYHHAERRQEVAADDGNSVLCAMVTSQLWMKDVHPALDTFLGLGYEFDEAFTSKYYVPGHASFVGTKRARQRAIGELLDRTIFDFIIGNTDRGMNDHNNFVYGGCSRSTECQLEPPSERIKGLAKYAYLDHGSSFHSHKEPQESPFFGDMDRIRICRYRRSTSDHLRRFRSQARSPFPLFTHVDGMLPTHIYKVAHESVLRKTQTRLDKIVKLIDRCLSQYPEDIVFSLPEYDRVRIAEEDETLPEDV